MRLGKDRFSSLQTYWRRSLRKLFFACSLSAPELEAVVIKFAIVGPYGKCPTELKLELGALSRNAALFLVLTFLGAGCQ